MEEPQLEPCVGWVADSFGQKVQVEVLGPNRITIVQVGMG
jgi:hypothetical protein